MNRIVIKRLLSLLVTSVLALAGVGALAQPPALSWTDPGMLSSDYEATLLGGSNVASVTLFDCSPGVTGGALGIRIQPAIPGLQMTWTVAVTRRTNSWSPATLGQMTRIEWELWAKVQGPLNWQGTRLVLQQGATFYQGPSYWEPPIFSSNWQRMGANDALPYAKIVGPGGSQPDFSAGAPPIRFGWVMSFGGVGITNTVTTCNSLFTIRAFAAPPRVRGSIGLGDWVAPIAGSSVTIEVRNVGSTSPLQVAVATLDASGNYAFDATVPPGTYDVTAKASHWLRQKRSSVTVGPLGATVNFALVNGDLDGDNSVDSDDYDILVMNFGGPGPTGDLNGIEGVTSDDFDILVANFGQTGSP